MLVLLYEANHQAGRLAFASFLSETADCDPADRSAWRGVEPAWARLRRRLDAHGFHEDIHIRPMLHIAALELARRLDAHHQHLERLGREIDDELAALRSIEDAGARRRAAAAFFRSVSTFLSEYGRQLTDEATLAMPALADGFHPTALFAARRALLASIACEEQWSAMPPTAPPYLAPEGSSLVQAARLSTPAFLVAARADLAARLAHTAPPRAPRLRRAA